MNDFKNLLKPHSPKILKNFTPWVPVLMEKYLKPDDLKLKVLESPRIVRLIEEVAKTEEDSKEIHDEVVKLLVEIGFSRSMLVIKSVGIALSCIMKRIYDGILVNMKHVERLKAQPQNSPILYLPCHRSYGDFILMSYICYACDVEIPGIAAGVDFFKMKGVGEMLRNTGAFFLRRSFASDKLYWNTFKEYVHSLITSYHSGVEFFLEGTRSRSCKSLPPKIGLLSMSLEPLFMGEISDITIVPVSIAYERPLEEQLFVYELLGMPKPKESTKGLLKSLSILKENFGLIYFDFGKPISVKDRLGSELDRFKHSLEPALVQDLNRNELSTIHFLAHDVLYLQQQGIVITTFNMVAFCFNYLKFKNRPTSNNLHSLLIQLNKILSDLGAVANFNADNAEKSLTDSVKVHQKLMKKHKNGNYELIQTDSDLFSNNGTMDGRRKMKGHKLLPKTMENSVPIFTIQLYINPLLHWLAPLGLVLLANTHGNGQEDFHILKELFSQEFVLHPKKVTYTSCCEQAVNLGIINEQRKIIKETEAELIISILAPFFLCYLHVVSVILSPKACGELEETTILTKTQEFVEKLLMENNNKVHPYSLSLDSISLAIQSLAQTGGLVKIRIDSGFNYTPNIENLRITQMHLEKFSTAFSHFDFLYNQNLIAKL